MKHILFSMALLIPIQVFSQMTDVYQDSTFSLSRIYAGINSTSTFPIDTMASYSNANFRLGFKSQLAVTDNLIFKTWGAVQIEKNLPVAGFNSIEVMLKPFQKWSIHAGLIATPTTVLRPNPTTWDSQAETRAQGTIIPGRPGTKVAYTLGETASLTYGYFNHGDEWAHHLNVSIEDWQLAGYRLDNGDYFAALRLNKGWLENTTTYGSTKELASTIFINFRTDLSLILDAQYTLEPTNLEFLQTSLRKYVPATPIHLSGFFGMTYDWKTKVVMGQVFIHLI